MEPLDEHPSPSLYYRHAIKMNEHDTNEIQSKENKMTKLYEIDQKNKTLFGTKLAVNSQGLWIMEIKGTSEVISVDKDTVTEVKPYTVNIRFLSGSTVYVYFANEGQYSEGDLLVVDNNNSTSPMAKVVSVGSKTKGATKWLSAWKISSEYVSSGE